MAWKRGSEDAAAGDGVCDMTGAYQFVRRMGTEAMDCEHWVEGALPHGQVSQNVVERQWR
jgi:hypothetical protein